MWQQFEKNPTSEKKLCMFLLFEAKTYKEFLQKSHYIVMLRKINQLELHKHQDQFMYEVRRLKKELAFKGCTMVSLFLYDSIR